MKGKRPLPDEIYDDRRHELIVSNWRALGEPSVGAAELIAIQEALADVFGRNQIPSPASIARELAQEGAELRHPEIIECDARWRASRVANGARLFDSLSALQRNEAPKLSEAESAIAQLERLRVQSTDEVDAREVKAFTVEARLTAENRAKDVSLSPSVREVQAEIAEWLRVWLETPNLFAQWLDLRKQTPAFRQKFGAG